MPGPTNSMTLFFTNRLVDGAHDGERHVHGADTGLECALEVDRDDIGIGDSRRCRRAAACRVAAALADGHRAECAVAGMGIAAEDHLAATGEVLGMNWWMTAMGRHVYATVLWQADRPKKWLSSLIDAAHVPGSYGSR